MPSARDVVARCRCLVFSPAPFNRTAIPMTSLDQRIGAAHTIREELSGILIFVGAIWATFLLSYLLPLNEQLALKPRSVGGLPGVVAMPFLHAGWGHLLANTPALLILLALLAGSRARSWLVVASIIILSGGLLWLFGRSALHIGASGLVFGLITFLIAAGWFERRLLAVVIAVITAVLFGGVLLTGVLPTAGANVSWDGHLCGAVAGVLTAYALTGRHTRY